MRSRKKRREGRPISLTIHQGKIEKWAPGSLHLSRGLEGIDAGVGGRVRAHAKITLSCINISAVRKPVRVGRGGIFLISVGHNSEGPESFVIAITRCHDKKPHACG